MKQVILVLGMHRSGTSALTRVISLLGAALPKSILGKNSSNLRGHWESEAMISVHDTMLAEYGSDWKDWRRLSFGKPGSRQQQNLGEMITETFTAEYPDNGHVSVIKEPRICRFARPYIETLEKDGAQIHSLIMVRHPLEVAASLTARDGLEKLDGLYLWLTHMLEAELATRGSSRQFVSYDAFLKAPVPLSETIQNALPFALPYGVEDVKKQIESYVSPDLKRQSAATEDIVLDPLARGWVSDAYEAFLVLCENPMSKGALKKLDNVSASYFPVLEPLHKALLSERDRLNTVLDEKVAEHNGLHREAFTIEQAKQKKAWAARDESHQREWNARDKAYQEETAARDEAGKMKWAAELARLNMIHDEKIVENNRLHQEAFVAEQAKQKKAWAARDESHQREWNARDKAYQEETAARDEAGKMKWAAELARLNMIHDEKIVENNRLHQEAFVAEQAKQKKAWAARDESHQREWNARDKAYQEETAARDEAGRMKLASELARLNMIHDEKIVENNRLHQESFVAEQTKQKKAWAARDQDHTEKLTALAEGYQRELNSRDTAYLKKLDAEELKHKGALDVLRSTHSSQIEQLKTAHDSERADLETRIANTEREHAVVIDGMSHEMNFMRDEFGNILRAVETRADRSASELEVLRGDMSSVLNSTSWKMTSSLRRLINALKGVKAHTPDPRLGAQDSPPRLEFKPNVSDP